MAKLLGWAIDVLDVITPLVKVYSWVWGHTAQQRGGAEFLTGGPPEADRDLRPTKRIGSDGPSRNAGK